MEKHRLGLGWLGQNVLRGSAHIGTKRPTVKRHVGKNVLIFIMVDGFCASPIIARYAIERKRQNELSAQFQLLGDMNEPEALLATLQRACWRAAQSRSIAPDVAKRWATVANALTEAEATVTAAQSPERASATRRKAMSSGESKAHKRQPSANHARHAKRSLTQVISPRPIPNTTPRPQKASANAMQCASIPKDTQPQRNGSPARESSPKTDGVLNLARKPRIAERVA